MGKTSMSVREMGRMLGLGKTDSYWLVHKNYFETRMVAGKMRVMVESFEKMVRKSTALQKTRRRTARNGTPAKNNDRSDNGRSARYQ